MRKTETEVKAELAKRKDRYFIKKATLKKRILSATICLAIIASLVTVAYLTPSGKKPTDNINSNIIYDNSHDFITPDISDITDTPDSSYIPDISEEPQTPDISETPDTSETPDVPDTPDVPTTPDKPITPDIPNEPDEPRPNVPKLPDLEVEMIHPTPNKDGKSLNLMSILSVGDVTGVDINSAFAKAQASFAAELFKGCAVGKDNTLVSPLSIMIAVSMVANGANGETKAAIETALGGLTTDELNQYLHSYIDGLPVDGETKLSINNAIWTNENYGINKNFLQRVLDYYGADAYMAPFTDQTVNDINAWIEENTDGEIKDMIKELREDAVMVLVNTLLFDARWAESFGKDQVVEDQPFTNANGTVTNVDYMHGHDDTNESYIETDKATGIIKDYKDGYKFVALLPKDENGLEELVASLTGKEIISMLNNAQRVDLSYKFPKFGFKCSISADTLKKTLTNMGMGVAFDRDQADFSLLYDNCFIDSILQDTFIKVNEEGTKAGAASIIIVPPTTGPEDPLPPKNVVFDRPFMYMIVDSSCDLPLFMGTVTDMSKSVDDAEVIPTDIPYDTSGSSAVTTDYNNDPIAPTVTMIRYENELAEYLEAHKGLMDAECQEKFLKDCDWLNSFYSTDMLIIACFESENNINYYADVRFYADDKTQALKVIMESNTTADVSTGKKLWFYIIGASDDIDYVNVDGEIKLMLEFK